MTTPVRMVIIGSEALPCKITYEAIIPDSAPVGPTILKLLPPKIVAKSPAQIAVTIPTEGSTFEATANAIDKGIETSETVIPAFQFNDRVCKKLIGEACILPENISIENHTEVHYPF